MTKLPEILLTICSAAFVIGVTVTVGNFDLPPAWSVAMPISAIFFGGFLVTRMLQDEMAKFDEERRSQVERAYGPPPSDALRPVMASVASGRNRVALAPAHSHGI